mmetsp:Transcript_36537/g.58931  ORF Transcript_36537/g.58931 Transcript_36537/m.58931 type:complete len:83 (-) Transcript_36537:42-290(-)
MLFSTFTEALAMISRHVTVCKHARCTSTHVQIVQFVHGTGSACVYASYATFSSHPWVPWGKLLQSLRMLVEFTEYVIYFRAL